MTAEQVNPQAFDWLAAMQQMEREVLEKVIVEIIGLGRKLYNPRFGASNIAAELDVDEKAVRCWRAGDYEPGLRKGLELLALRDAMRAKAV